MGNYEAEFNEKIVRLHLEEGRTIRSLADEYDISKASISNWVKITVKNAKQTMMPMKIMIL